MTGNGHTIEVIPPQQGADQATDGGGDYLDAIVGNTRSHPTTDSQPNMTSTQSLPNKKSGIFGASANLVNTIVGAGIIGIPYSLRQCGLIAGVFLLILVGYLTDKSLRMIVETASFHPKLRTRQVLSFEDMMRYPYGRLGWGFILFNMFILAYGAMIAYLIIIKDTVPTILGLAEGSEGSFVEREMVMIATSLIVILPLSLQRDMASLAVTSLLSVTADVILVGFVAAFSPIKSTVADAGGFGEVLRDDWLNPTLFVGLGIVSTAMACQHSAFIVSGSLQKITVKRWGSVTFRSISCATILCLILGVCGYLGFLDETEGDVLNNFPAHSRESNGARALLAITMFFTYPMEAFVARHVFVKLMYNGNMDGEVVPETGAFRPEFLCFSRRYFLTLGIYALTLIPALLLDDLGPVLSITGSLGASCLSYIAPGMVFFGVNGDVFLSYIGKLLAKHRGTESTTGDIELPVAGDANTTMQPSQPVFVQEGSKPWWWFPCLMPIWVGLASSGQATMKEMLENEQGMFQNSDSAKDEYGDEIETVEPRIRDFWIAAFLIVFGVVAAVAGIGSNIYVQVNDIFFSPS